MVPDPETSEVVQKIFEYAVNGMNAADIARELSRQQIPTPGEHKARKGIKTHDVSRTHGMWCNSTVLRILADERYMGTYVIGKREVTEIGGHKMRSKAESDWIKIPDHHIPLVNEEIFSKANASIQRFKIPNLSLIHISWSVIINMEKELNTDTQTALLELRGFFRDERSVFLCRFIKLPNTSAYLTRMTNQR